MSLPSHAIFGLCKLTKQELIILNQEVVSLIKTQRDIDFKKASIAFNKGDIVSFSNSNGVRVYGVITKKNPKTLQVNTQDKCYINIPATYLTIETKPPKKLLEFKKEVVPTYEDIHEMLELEFKKRSFN